MSNIQDKEIQQFTENIRFQRMCVI